MKPVLCGNYGNGKERTEHRFRKLHSLVTDMVGKEGKVKGSSKVSGVREERYR